jgi:branched-chain amino acid transport system substrate-binding protein
MNARTFPCSSLNSGPNAWGPRRRRAAIGLLGLALATSASAADKIKIGFISTLSGPGAVIGIALRDGFNIALKQTGGKLGGLPAEVLMGDDQQNPDVGRQLADRMVKRDKVDIVTGVVFQNILSAVEQPVLSSGTFLLGANTGPSYFAGERCHPNFFAVSWVSDGYGEATGKLARDAHYKKVFVIAANYPGGRDVVSGFRRFYTAPIAGEASPRLGQIDFSAELAQARAAKPDAVFIFLPGGMGVSFLKQWSQTGMDKETTLLATGWNLDQDTITAVGAATVGAVSTTHWNYDFDNPQSKRFVKDFEKEYGRLPAVYASQGYDAAMLLDTAIRDVKGNLDDKNALRAAIRAARFKSVRGEFKFGTNHFPIQDYYSQQVVLDKGKLVNKTLGKVLTQRADAYGLACKMPAGS